MKNLSLVGDIDRDYAKLENHVTAKLQSSNTFFEKSVNVRKIHYKLFVLKDLVQRIDTYDDVKMDINILMSALIYILRGDSFTAMSVIRPAMELIPQILLTKRNEVPQKKFSVNLEKLLSVIKKEYISTLKLSSNITKQQLNPRINSFCTASKELYWDLSDYTHVSNKELLDYTNLIDSILEDQQMSEDDFLNGEKVAEKLIRVINFVMELIILDSSLLITERLSSELLGIYLAKSSSEFSNLKNCIFSVR